MHAGSSSLHFQKFERRGCQVRDGEEDKWKDVKVSMMSDEEDMDGRYAGTTALYDLPTS